MPAPDIVYQLVETFNANAKHYRSTQYNETEVRRQFVDVLFEALEWDVSNRLRRFEVKHEARQHVHERGRQTPKHPDYAFLTHGSLRFFVETKAPHVNLKNDTKPAYQLRRYGWSAKLPVSVLTDFEEFSIYDCRVQPQEKDKPTVARIRYFSYQDYVEKWDELAALFSRDAVYNGALDALVGDKKLKGSAEVDEAFLREMEGWREMLAKDIALHNPHLTQRQLNMAVQLIIDRIVFLRIAEDRGIEPYGRLSGLTGGVKIYPSLVGLFKDADAKYNSGLFHFSDEKGREEPDEITPALTLSDETIQHIISRLYYPTSPYEFSVLPADILGQVYERFLGKVITLSASGAAKVEEKPEVRKAGGVYYTPTYIVEYIVKHTVGALVEGKTPEQVAQLRILDPACGSGSFLLGAFDYLIRWHRDWYVKDGADKHTRGKNPTLRKVNDAEGTAADYVLTAAEKKRILLNNLYGVDLDQQAVEVTKLSLLLKVLEGETAQTAQPSLLVTERVLPDLSTNIKWGNSLIGSDFYDGVQMHMFEDQEALYRVKAFDWRGKDGFQQIMVSGGFDAVIGNPPYVRQETLGTEFKKYAQRRYQTYAGTADLYVYFIEKGISLLNAGGTFGMIIANKWMRANYGSALRKWLKRQAIREIIDFGDLPVFADATTYPCIVVVDKADPTPSPSPLVPRGEGNQTPPLHEPANGEGVGGWGQFLAAQIDTLQFADLADYVKPRRFAVSRAGLDDAGWALVDEAAQALLTKLRGVGVPLGKYVGGKIYYGIKTGLNEAFVIDAAKRAELIAKDPKSAELIKPFLAGRDVKRFESPESDHFLILLPNGWTNQQAGNVEDKWAWLQKTYPAVAEHLEPYAEKAQKRWDKGQYWWELRPCEYYDDFNRPKIIFPDISNQGNFAFDKKGEIYSTNTTYFMPKNDLYLVGVLNSHLFNFIYARTFSVYRGGYYRFFTQYIEQLPIRTINFDDPADKTRHDQMVALVTKMLDLHQQRAALPPDDKTRRAILDAQIERTDAEIDALVYDLYGLTEDEIKTVEGRA